jgi:hypothetical protein
VSVFSQLWLTVADLALMRGFYERALFGRPPDMDTATGAFWTLGRDGAHAVSFALHVGEPERREATASPSSWPTTSTRRGRSCSPRAARGSTPTPWCPATCRVSSA